MNNNVICRIARFSRAGMSDIIIALKNLLLDRKVIFNPAYAPQHQLSWAKFFQYAFSVVRR